MAFLGLLGRAWLPLCYLPTVIGAVLPLGQISVVATGLGGQTLQLQMPRGSTVWDLEEKIAEECGDGVKPVHIQLLDGTELLQDGAKTLSSEPGNVTHLQFVVLKYESFRTGDELRAAANRYFTHDEKARTAIAERYGPVERWDVSKVSDMQEVFMDLSWEYRRKHFNPDLSRWDTSSATAMDDMFSGCFKFNANLSRWKTSWVTTMCSTFFSCKDFKADLSGWNLSSLQCNNGMLDATNLPPAHRPRFPSHLSGSAGRAFMQY